MKFDLSLGVHGGLVPTRPVGANLCSAQAIRIEWLHAGSPHVLGSTNCGYGTLGYRGPQVRSNKHVTHAAFLGGCMQFLLGVSKGM